MGTRKLGEHCQVRWPSGVHALAVPRLSPCERKRAAAAATKRLLHALPTSALCNLHLYCEVESVCQAQQACNHVRAPEPALLPLPSGGQLSRLLTAVAHSCATAVFLPSFAALSSSADTRARSRAASSELQRIAIAHQKQLIHLSATAGRQCSSTAGAHHLSSRMPAPTTTSSSKHQSSSSPT